MGRSQRVKGRRGQSIAANLLRDRDWQVDPISAGIRREDIIATDPYGVRYSVEVKNQQTAAWAQFRAQARAQAEERRLPWMLMVRVPSTCAWWVERKGERPVVWHEKTESK